MTRIPVVSILLAGFFGLAVQIRAVPQEGSEDIKQKVSKTATKAAAQAIVHYQGAPRFAPIEGTSIAYATNSPEAVLNIAGAFYLLFTYFNPVARGMQDVWLVSASAHGPWIPAHSIPARATAIVCGQINTARSEPLQLCTLPRPN
jgi:hypothetical protein